MAAGVFFGRVPETRGETPPEQRFNREAAARKAAAVRPEATVLAQSGLAGMEAASDADGRRVRGSYGGSWTSGMSFVAGMLFDPTTASSLRGSSANSSEAFAGPYRYLPSRTESAQISGLELALRISQGGTPTFAGSLFGVANGYGVTRP
jgi:hypothetical protein